jgi:hypothetical protein
MLQADPALRLLLYRLHDAKRMGMIVDDRKGR